jgi:hypothetical protein
MNPLQGAFWSWATGWFNLVGQINVTDAINYVLATFIFNMVLITDFSLKAVAWRNVVL